MRFPVQQNHPAIGNLDCKSCSEKLKSHSIGGFRDAQQRWVLTVWSGHCEGSVIIADDSGNTIYQFVAGSHYPNGSVHLLNPSYKGQ